MADDFAHGPYNIESPARNAEAADISAADHTFSKTTRGVYVGGAGNLIVTLAGGQEVTFVGVTAGTILPICAVSVTRTDTTATDILGLW